MKCLWIAPFALCLLTPVLGSADTLLIDSINTGPANAAGGLLRPIRGMSMTLVEQKFGAPNNKLAAVGAPPITRWNYARYSVYFEHHLVLTSVVKR